MNNAVLKTSTWWHCPACERLIIPTHREKHIDSKVCEAHASTLRFREQGWAPCSLGARRHLDALQIAYEPGECLDERQKARATLYAPEPIAVVCNIIKGAHLRWALSQIRDDEEFREAVIAMHRIQHERPAALLKFLFGQWESGAKTATKEKGVSEESDRKLDELVEHSRRMKRARDMESLGIAAFKRGDARSPPNGLDQVLSNHWLHGYDMAARAAREKPDGTR